MLEREMCRFVHPVGNGTQHLFSVKVIMTLINIPEYWVLGETYTQKCEELLRSKYRIRNDSIIDE